MKVVVGDRGTGKTHQLCRWVLEGHKLDGGGWSRVILVSNLAHQRVVLREISKMVSGDPRNFHSVDRSRVLVVTGDPRQLSSTRGISSNVEVAVDDAGEMLQKMLWFLGVAAPLAAMSVQADGILTLDATATAGVASSCHGHEH